MKHIVQMNDNVNKIQLTVKMSEFKLIDFETQPAIVVQYLFHLHPSKRFY